MQYISKLEHENYFDSFGNTRDQKPQNKKCDFFRYIVKVL